MREIIIHSLIWATQSVGVAEDKVDDDLCIKIDYKNKFGDLLYPDMYFIKKEKVFSYPTQTWKGKKLYIIPIKDLEILPKWGQPLN
jgi:hypothetical protein